MTENRVKFNNIVRNQLPSYVREEFPLVAEFLSQYYIAQEFQGAPLDLLQNIDQYIKLNETTNLNESVVLLNSIEETDTTITVDLLSSPRGTTGFPDSYGLIKIGNEIITYTGKTVNSFTGCVRGFSGISSYGKELEFSETSAEEHTTGDVIYNLSSLFLQEFLQKVKYQIAPGLDNRSFDQNLNENLFLKQVKDFYSSKGTDRSFEILFKALYDEEVSIIRPREYLFRPSDAHYRITNDFSVESVEGNPFDLENLTLFQKQYKNINSAYGPITAVEKINTKGEGDYYRIKIDAGYNRDIDYDGAVYGGFSVHPKTKIIGDVVTGSSFIDVESTVGFPNSGELTFTYPDGTTGITSYTSKTVTQFLGCDNIVANISDAVNIGINTYAYATTGFGTEIRIRINSVLNKLDADPKSYFYKKGDTIALNSLGINEFNLKSKYWMLNASTTYNVSAISVVDTANKIYSVTVDQTHILKLGDNVVLTDQSNTEYTGKVSDVNSDKVAIVKFTQTVDTSSIKKYTLKRNISKVNSLNYPGLNIISSNIQNIYSDKDKTLVASNSLPKFENTQIKTTDKKVTFSGTFSGDTLAITTLVDHGFYTGDEVYYAPEKVTTTTTDFDGNLVTTVSNGTSLFAEGLYFAQRVSSTEIKLARSRSDIDNSRFVEVSSPTTVTNNTLVHLDFNSKELKNQKIFREIAIPENDGKIYETLPGKTGILVNGVEILNYKSTDVLYYGQIDNVNVTSTGSGYDIINPPDLLITDRVGTGATGFCAISGSLQRIDIIDSGFDYQETPVIKITGGNGAGAQALANMKLIPHEIAFNTEVESAQVSLGATQSTIGFSTYHKFRNGESVIYKTDRQTAIGGLQSESVYYVSVQTPYIVKLHGKQTEAISGINTISLTSYGVGNHTLETVNKKSVVDSISIVSSGSGYENKKRTCQTVGVNTSTNEISISNHGYNSGEIVKYYNDGTPISGITTNTEYYLTKVDDDTFRLSNKGSTNQGSDFYYRTKQYIEFTSIGSGTHTFNYPEINVEVLGNVGINSISGYDFKAQVRPIFRGSINSVHLLSNGSGYGSSQTLNYQRQPNFDFLVGSNAELTPIVSNGQIVEVLVNNVGKNYKSTPDLIVNGSGQGASLTPVIENGQIVSVKVVSGGFGYTQDTTSILVSSSGSGFRAAADIQTWNVNLFQKNFNSITDDDGFLTNSDISDSELQYSNLYAPRKLREMVFSIDQSGKILYSKKDLRKSGNLEIKSTDHSPIIGWAYDGNPIYGPYGYSTKQGGSIAQMKSGYVLDLKSNRPSTSNFPEGFFIEDYSYYEIDDDTVLDENNGRFCVTPDFPNGTYAYFATVNDSGPDSSGSFFGYKRPVFPYLVGNAFKSKPNEFNFKASSNQDEIDLNSTNWKRNTYFYNLKQGNQYYEYLNLPNNLNQTIDIKSTFTGNVDKIGIVTGGSGYRVNDKLVFDNLDSNNTPRGYGVSAKVSNLLGSYVNSISVASTSIYNVDIYPGFERGTYDILSSDPHGFVNLDIITLSGLSTTSSFLEGFNTAGISSNSLFLVGTGSSTVGLHSVGVTGIVTYVSVKGNITANAIRENDILQINEERLKVLNIDSKNSRIRVLREIDGTVGVSHTVAETVYEVPRKIVVNAGYRSDFTYRRNKEIYFDPSESLGIGTVSGVGIGITLSFSNPGAGISEIFIPTRSIYLPNHGLLTGDILTYSPNNGSVIEVSPDGISTSVVLSDPSTLYVAKLSDDLIGLSTVKVGLGTTGVFSGISTDTSSIGILYFTGIGTGSYHSFETNYTKLTGTVSKNVVTVSTAQTHGLQNDDNVYIDVNPSTASTYVIKYNEFNRVMVVNPQSFVASGVNTESNTITITDHGFETGQKVIHTSSSPSGGLENNGKYYVVVFDENTFKLSDTFYGATQLKPSIVGISSTSFGEISLVNPKLNLYKDSNVTFDLSDSSLSYYYQTTQYPAFKLDFYSDSNFSQQFITSKNSRVFDLQKYGRVGISTDARSVLSVTDSLPEKLYYKLTPVFNSNLPENKEKIVVDSTVESNSELIFNNSGYNGKQKITVGTTTSFTYNLFKKPEASSYTSGISSIVYSTDSLNATGPINGVKIDNRGFSYSSLPGITTVTSSVGLGAILECEGNSIGRLKDSKIKNIGFNFPTDYTLSPSAILPQVIKIEPLSSFLSIGISSVGRGYTSAPDLIVFDGKTNEQISEIDLRYEIGDNSVTIFRNTYGISQSSPRILPVNNTNGVGISTISFNEVTKDVTVVLSVGFSTANSFPFRVNDKVMIENISVGIGSTAKGYNSDNYNYALFTLTSVDENLGGIGSVTYNLSDYLFTSEIPGIFDPVNSAGRIIAEKDFPIFDIKLTKNDYLVGEDVKSNSVSSGVVDSWDSKNNYIKIISDQKFVAGEIIEGQSSNTQGIASSITSFDSFVRLSSSTKVENGWESQAGYLNNNLQRVQDNYYYQNFSYSLKSKVAYDTWEDVVGSLNHTAGFKKFSDYQLETTDSSNSMVVGLSTNTTSIEIVTDIIGVVDLNCVYDFDLVRENSLEISSRLFSNQIFFENAVLTDYLESVGNRVLSIDDVSGQFNSNPRPTRYSEVFRFNLDDIRSQKYITYVKDKRYYNERQLLLVTLVHDKNQGYISQYGRLNNTYDMGTFDFAISGTDGILNFYPTKYSLNNFDVSILSYNLDDSIASVGNTSIGGISLINTDSVSVSSGATTIVSIANTYTSAKVLVQVYADGGSYQFEELNIIHNGTDVELLEYGQLNTYAGSYASSGLGTYSAYIDGSSVKVDFTPSAGIGTTTTINTIQVALASTSYSGIGTVDMKHARLEARTTSIASSVSPVENVIGTYPEVYDVAYFVVQVSDTINNEHQISEVVVIEDYDSDLATGETYIVEYGNLETVSGLGTIGSRLNGSAVELVFTPLPNIETHVNVYMNALRHEDDEKDIIDFNNSTIETAYGNYQGTDFDIKRAFNLTHKNFPIFERYFDGSDSSIVNVSGNSIIIPNHFFVSGEKLNYHHAGAGTTQAVSIASTTIPGIGVTDKLPSEVYVIKDSESKIRLASTAENALKATPEALDIVSVGIGTSHRFVANTQNSKVIVSIDNVIQSPIVSTALTTTLAANLSSIDDVVYLSGITSFFGGDLVRIGDEIMRIDAVGFGSTNSIVVRRPWVGTSASTYTVGSLITKVEGNYNIVDNVLNFVSAPYGNLPLSSTTNPPDERDWTGISTGSSFHGRSFMRSGILNTTDETYHKNYIYDDISNQFNGEENSFTLTSSGANVTGVSTENAIVLLNEIFQGPAPSLDYTLNESLGITSISFTGAATSAPYDINTSTLPIGGVIISVGSTEGFGYQPLVSAGGTAVVSGLGTISSISIGNSGSGYRAGIQTVVNVGVATSSTGTPNIEFIGTASISGGHIVSVAITNPGTGYTSSNPPLVIFDSPLSYSDIPLSYSSSSSGLGTQATVDIVVGQGSSVIDFEIKNTGYGYREGEVLTVPISGLTGIPTTSSFSEFQITIQNIFTDKFSAWSIGELQVIDSIQDLFDGGRRVFELKVSDNLVAIRSSRGSNINVEDALLVFVNDILQVPGEGYEFSGGSLITFTEAPKLGDTCKILFYKGTGSIDVLERDILETVKVGDELTIGYDSYLGQPPSFQEEFRTVTQINSTDYVTTNPYFGPGNTDDETLIRPVVWCRQTEDKIINGQEVGKDRTLYEPAINPFAYAIQSVGIGTTIISVDNIRPFFNQINENNSDLSFQDNVTFISQDTKVSASATAVVSGLGTISSIVITDGGIGYSTTPSVTIQNPVGLGTTARAEATASITSGVVTSITVTGPGTGYTSSNVPLVLIESPTFAKESNAVDLYEGDSGIIVGVTTTNVGVSTGIILDLYIPEDSFFRDSSIIGVTTISGIQTGYYMSVYSSNVGNGVTSIDSTGNQIGIGTTCLDNIYEVISVSIGQTYAPGIGLTHVAKAVVSVTDYNGLSGIGNSNYYGNYSWGRIRLTSRSESEEYNAYTSSGFAGITTGTIVQRTSALKYSNYT